MFYYYTRNDILDYELYLIHQDLSIGRTNGQQHIITQEVAPEGVSEALIDCEESTEIRGLSDNFNSMVSHIDQPQIHKMVTSLASNLRYTIKGDTLVPLKQEMSHVNDYIFLQKIRMDEALAFSSAIDPATENCLIPKISIQTLVENSIIHGKSGSTDKIHIEVSAQYHDNNIIIIVRDNGCGIAPQQLDKLYADFNLQKNTGIMKGVPYVQSTDH